MKTLFGKLALMLTMAAGLVVTSTASAQSGQRMQRTQIREIGMREDLRRAAPGIQAPFTRLTTTAPGQIQAQDLTATPRPMLPPQGPQILTPPIQPPVPPHGPQIFTPPIQPPVPPPGPQILLPPVQPPIPPQGPGGLIPPPVQPLPPVLPPLPPAVSVPAVAPVIYVEPALPVLPATCIRIPRLQFTGRMIPGYGMQVVSVRPGGVACRLGLEPGDIIVQIDGRAIRCVNDYETALFNGAVYGGGHVDLVIRNVRYRPGCSINPLYVTRHAVLPSRYNTMLGRR